MKKPIKNKSGFTLIELMIVIAIVGILASVAIPQYVKYTNRTKFTEVILATAQYKTSATLAYEVGIPISGLTSGTNGITPEINASSPTVSSHVGSISISAGVITAISNPATLEAGNTGVGAVYRLEATESNDGLQWLMNQSESTCLRAGFCAPQSFTSAATN